MASVWIGKIEVQWDDEKAASNLRKHGITFVEAATVFEDEDGLYQADAEHSDTELRFTLIGLSSRSNLITVVHVERDPMCMRIISARGPSNAERRAYERQVLGRP